MNQQARHTVTKVEPHDAMYYLFQPIILRTRAAASWFYRMTEWDVLFGLSDKNFVRNKRVGWG